MYWIRSTSFSSPMFVQQRFDVELEAEDLVRANLSTLSNVSALIERKRAAAG